jgi:hypothetical protein
MGASAGSGAAGGNGGDGRIRLEDADGTVENLTVARPEASLGRLMASGGGQIPGDLGQNGTLSIADAVALLSALFGMESRPLPCEGETVTQGGNLLLLDVNRDGQVNLSDPVYVLKFLFLGGSPPAPGNECVWIAGCPDVCEL